MGFKNTKLWFLSPFKEPYSTLSHLSLGFFATTSTTNVLWIVIILYQLINFMYGNEKGSVSARLPSIVEYMMGAVIAHAFLYHRRTLHR